MGKPSRTAVLTFLGGLLVKPARCQANASAVYRVGVIASEPFACTDQSPCFPTGIRAPSTGTCVHNGIKTTDGKCVHGIIPDMLKMLEVMLSSEFEVTLIPGVGYTNIVQECSSPGSSGKFQTGMCGGKHCDMVAGDVTITWTRKQTLNARFSEPWKEVGLQLYMRYREGTWVERASLAMKPFSLELWLAWMTMLVGGAITFVWLENAAFRKSVARCDCLRYLADHWERHKEKTNARRHGPDLESVRYLSPGDAWFHSLMSNFFAQDNYPFQTKSSRTLLVVISLMILLLVACYTASCTYFLTRTQINWQLAKIGSGELPPDVWKRLGKSVQAASPGSLILSKGGSTSAFVKGHMGIDTECEKSSTTCKFVKDINTAYENSASKYENNVNALKDKTNLAWIGEDLTFNYMLARLDWAAGDGESESCRQHWNFVGDKFFITTYGFVFGPSLTSPVQDLVNQEIRKMKSDRSLDSLVLSWFNESAPCNLDERESEQSQLRFADFSVLFGIVGGLAVFLFATRSYQHFCTDPSRLSPPAPDDTTPMLEILDHVEHLNREMWFLRRGHDADLPEIQETSLLPDGWQSRTDVRYGKRYFQGRYSRKTQWEEPTEPDMPPGLSKKKLRSIPRSQRAFTNKPKNSMVDRVHEARRMPAFGIDRAAPFAANVYDPYYHGPREYVQRFNNVPPDVITLSGDLVAHGVRPYVDDSTYSDESSREESLVNFATMHDHRV